MDKSELKKIIFKVPDIQLQAITDSINQALAPIQDINKMMNGYADQIKKQHDELITMFSFDLTPILDSYNSASKLVSKTTETFQNLTKSFDFSFIEKMDELIKEMAKSDAEMAALLKESGWFFSPTMMDLAMVDIQEALIKYKEGDKDAIYNLVRTTFCSNEFENLKNAQKNWSLNDYFSGRENIINQAINAHIRGEYALSIPVLITQIEGIAGEFCEKNSVEVMATDRNGKKTLRKITTKNSNGGYKLQGAINNEFLKGGIFHPEVLLSLIDSIIFTNTDNLGKDYSTILNRHGILHGNIKMYDSEINSYKCILLLDVLSELKKRNLKLEQSNTEK